MFDGKQIAQIGVEIEIAIELHAVTAVVASGRLSALRSGRADVAAELAIEGVQLARATRPVELPMEIGLGAGIPLLSRADVATLPPAPTDEPTIARYALTDSTDIASRRRNQSSNRGIAGSTFRETSAGRDPHEHGDQARDQGGQNDPSDLQAVSGPDTKLKHALHGFSLRLTSLEVHRVREQDRILPFDEILARRLEAVVDRDVEECEQRREVRAVHEDEVVREARGAILEGIAKRAGREGDQRDRSRETSGDREQLAAEPNQLLEPFHGVRPGALLDGCIDEPDRHHARKGDDRPHQAQESRSELSVSEWEVRLFRAPGQASDDRPEDQHEEQRGRKDDPQPGRSSSDVAAKAPPCQHNGPAISAQ